MIQNDTDLWNIGLCHAIKLNVRFRSDTIVEIREEYLEIIQVQGTTSCSGSVIYFKRPRDESEILESGVHPSSENITWVRRENNTRETGRKCRIFRPLCTFIAHMSGVPSCLYHTHRNEKRTGKRWWYKRWPMMKKARTKKEQFIITANENM